MLPELITVAFSSGGGLPASLGTIRQAPVLLGVVTFVSCDGFLRKADPGMRTHISVPPQGVTWTFFSGLDLMAAHRTSTLLVRPKGAATMTLLDGLSLTAVYRGSCFIRIMSSDHLVAVVLCLPSFEHSQYPVEPS